MDSDGRNRRPALLLAVAALLIVVGLVSAMSAPGAPPRSNKADAYGGPVAPKPKNPKSVAECNKYYGSGNNLADARECRAIAHKNIGLKKCAKKKGSARAKCVKAVNRKFANEKAAVTKQRAAEKACSEKHNATFNSLDPDAPDYDTKLQAASEEFNDCMTKARA
ncbi:MAG TPA: hypothetical protein VF066_02580 [Thermoleophilaceae bacterium]